MLRQALVGVCALLAALSVAQAYDESRWLHAASLRGVRVQQAAREWQALRLQAHAAPTHERLERVNRFFNARIAFASDEQVWGVVDYWASPLEALNKGAGDCEDYAIAKYFGALSLGIPVSRLRLVYVRARLDASQVQAHMVLAYYPEEGGDALILDNLVDEIQPGAARRDLTPVFSFNTEGLWQGVGSVSAGDPVARLSRWRELIAKVRAEGFH